MAQAIADVLKQNMETVRPEMPALFELESYPSQMIKKAAEKHRISRTPNSSDFRAPLKIQPPGRFGTFSRAGGSLGTGTGYKVEQLVQTCFPLKLGVELNVDVRWATEKTDKAIVDAFRENLKDAIPNFQRYDDASWHNITSGNQGLVGLSSSYSGGVFTMSAEHGADLVQIGQDVEIFSNDLGTHRTSAVTPDNLPYASAVDKGAKTITVTNLGAITPSNDDYLAFPGVGATPAWCNGLYYFNNSATSGNLLGLSRTTVPEVNSNVVSGSAGLDPELAYQLWAKIKQRRGKVKKMRGFIHMAQAAQIYTKGIQISEWQRGSKDSMIDIFPEISDTITWGGVPHRLDIHQSRQRIDWLNLDTWGRVYEKEVGFYEDLEGRRFFVKRDSSGNVSAADLFYIVYSGNFFCVDPGSQGFIHSLPIPTGF